MAGCSQNNQQQQLLSENSPRCQDQRLTQRPFEKSVFLPNLRCLGWDQNYSNFYSFVSQLDEKQWDEFVVDLNDVFFSSNDEKLNHLIQLMPEDSDQLSHLAEILEFAWSEYQLGQSQLMPSGFDARTLHFLGNSFLRWLNQYSESVSIKKFHQLMNYFYSIQQWSFSAKLEQIGERLNLLLPAFYSAYLKKGKNQLSLAQVLPEVTPYLAEDVFQLIQGFDIDEKKLIQLDDQAVLRLWSFLKSLDLGQREQAAAFIDYLLSHLKIEKWTESLLEIMSLLFKHQKADLIISDLKNIFADGEFLSLLKVLSHRVDHNKEMALTGEFFRPSKSLYQKIYQSLESEMSNDQLSHLIFDLQSLLSQPQIFRSFLFSTDSQQSFNLARRSAQQSLHLVESVAQNPRQAQVIIRSLPLQFKSFNRSGNRQVQEIFNFLQKENTQLIPLLLDSLAKGKLDLNRLSYIVFALNRELTRKEVEIYKDGLKVKLSLNGMERLELLLKNAAFLDGFFGSYFVNTIAQARSYRAGVDVARRYITMFGYFGFAYRRIDRRLPDETPQVVHNIDELFDIFYEIEQIAGFAGTEAQEVIRVLQRSSPEHLANFNIFRTSLHEQMYGHGFQILSLMSQKGYLKTLTDTLQQYRATQPDFRAHLRLIQRSVFSERNHPFLIRWFETVAIDKLALFFNELPPQRAWELLVNVFYLQSRLGDRQTLEKLFESFLFFVESKHRQWGFIWSLLDNFILQINQVEQRELIDIWRQFFTRSHYKILLRMINQQGGDWFNLSLAPLIEHYQSNEENLTQEKIHRYQALLASIPDEINQEQLSSFANAIKQLQFLFPSHQP